MSDRPDDNPADDTPTERLDTAPEQRSRRRWLGDGVDSSRVGLIAIGVVIGIVGSAIWDRCSDNGPEFGGHEASFVVPGPNHVEPIGPGGFGHRGGMGHGDRWGGGDHDRGDMREFRECMREKGGDVLPLRRKSDDLDEDDFEKLKKAHEECADALEEDDDDEESAK